MQAIAELRTDMEQLKSERQQDILRMSHTGSRAGPSRCVGDDDVAGPPRISYADSPGNFSGFTSEQLSSEEGEIHEEGPSRSVLLQSALAFGPVEEVSGDVDRPIADMVNQLFAHGMREESYKDIVEDEVTKRPGNCPALAPVECNEQILEALKSDAKRSDFRMKEVGKDILRAATIIVKSLSVLDRVAQDEGNSVVAHEVGMVNGALALLGHANYKNNLARRFNIKREINPKYSHLCSDKVPMTSLLFGDDVSQSARQIDESEKLKSKFTTKKPFPTWKPGSGKFGGGKTRGFFGKTSHRGASSRFQPYGLRKSGYKGDQRHSYPRQEAESKNSRGRGHSIPRQ